MKTLGATLKSVSEEKYRFTYHSRAVYPISMGLRMPGAITSIVDSACGYAALTKVPDGCEVVTAEFKINFLRPAIGDFFVAVGNVVNPGKKLVVCTGEVRAFVANEPGFKVVALMQATVSVITSQR